MRRPLPSLWVCCDLRFSGDPTRLGRPLATVAPPRSLSPSPRCAGGFSSPTWPPRLQRTGLPLGSRQRLLVGQAVPYSPVQQDAPTAGQRLPPGTPAPEILHTVEVKPLALPERFPAVIGWERRYVAIHDLLLRVPKDRSTPSQSMRRTGPVLQLLLVGCHRPKLQS